MKIKSEEIKIVDIGSIIKHPNNRNKHSKKQIGALSKIIKIRGFREPLTVSKRSGFLISGHARLDAAREIGMTSIPVMYQDFDSEADEHAHLAACNEIARYAEFDQMGFIDDLKGAGLDLSIVDFEEYGLIDFSIDLMPEGNPSDDNLKEDTSKKWILEVTLANELELRDLNDDLRSKGYQVREK